MQEPTDDITHVIIGISSLVTLSFIPGVIAGLSGSRLTTISSTKVRGLVRGVFDRVNIMMGWAATPEIYSMDMPFNKPDKKK